MMQVVLHHFPGAQVEYRFKCRNAGVDLTPYIDEIRDEVRALTRLRFAGDELAYLRGWRFFKSDFVDLLGLFQLDERFIRVERMRGARTARSTSRSRGPWLHTILFEVPLLAIVSEVYFRNTAPNLDLAEGRRRLAAKIERINAVPDPEFRIADYGTRRRFSRAWQDEVVRTLAAGHRAEVRGHEQRAARACATA